MPHSGFSNSMAPPDYAKTLSMFSCERAWSKGNEQVLLEPYLHLYAQPGKNIRTQLIAAFDLWLQVPKASLDVITRVVAMLHTASLMVDDVEDNASLRRGVPVSHHIFGVPQTINSANYMYFCALKELSSLQNPHLVAVYTEELVNLHRGQGMDLFWRETLTCPSEEEYLDMVNNKTGGLFRLAIKLMQAESACTTNFVPLVNLIGIIFQIRDDYMNLQDEEYTNNKGFCEDLTEGKFSFPIIHAIHADPSNRQILNTLKQKSADNDVKLFAVNYMKSTTRSFDYTLAVLETLAKSARAELARLGGNDGLGRILDRLLSA